MHRGSCSAARHEQGHGLCMRQGHELGRALGTHIGRARARVWRGPLPRTSVRARAGTFFIALGVPPSGSPRTLGGRFQRTPPRTHSLLCSSADRWPSLVEISAKYATPGFHGRNLRTTHRLTRSQSATVYLHKSHLFGAAAAQLQFASPHVCDTTICILHGPDSRSSPRASA